VKVGMGSNKVLNHCKGRGVETGQSLFRGLIRKESSLIRGERRKFLNQGWQWNHRGV